MPEDDLRQAISISLPHATVEGFAKMGADLEAASVEGISVQRDIASIVRQNSAQRVAFFERLILVEGGTFALSLTYIAALAGHPGATAISIVTLNAGWVALFGSMLFSFASIWVMGSLQAYVDMGTHAHVKAREQRAWSRLALGAAALFKDAVVTAGPELPAPISDVLGAAGKQFFSRANDTSSSAAKSTRAAMRFIKIGNVVAIAANASAVVAFAMLCWFAFQTSAIFLMK